MILQPSKITSGLSLISPVLAQWWDNDIVIKKALERNTYGKVVFMADIINNIVGGRYYILDL